MNSKAFSFITKKNLIIALILVTLLSMYPGISLAAGPDTDWYTNAPAGAGDSAADPYIISNADQLAGLAQLVNSGNNFNGKYLKVDTAASIDLSGFLNWIPIGTLTNPFKGSFDGNNKIINGLTIDDTQTLASSQRVGLGLFGCIGTGGSVKKLTLDTISITINHSINSDSSAVSFVGGIAGLNEGTVSDCAVSGNMKVDGVDIKAGGIAGHNGSDSGSTGDNPGTILNCTTNCSITATSCYQMAHVGGIAGGSTKPGGVIENCSSIGSVDVSGKIAFAGSYKAVLSVGGLVGYIDGTNVTNCTSSSTVNANQGSSQFSRHVYSGGLIGEALKSGILNCDSSGNVTAQGGDDPVNWDIIAAGGLVGGLSSASTIDNCLSTGNVQAKADNASYATIPGYAFAGGLAGYVKIFGDPSTISQSYATGAATSTALNNGNAFSGGLGGYLGNVLVEKGYSSGNASSASETGGYAASGCFSGYVKGSSVTNCYATGDAEANCVTKESSGGFVGALAANSTNTFTNCYSSGHSSVAHTGATFFDGGFIGAAAGTCTVTNCYYDSTVNAQPNAVGNSGSITGSVTALSTSAMTDDAVLTGDMNNLPGSDWMKRSNTSSEWYYPELNCFGSSADSAIASASQTSVTTTAADTTAPTLSSASASNLTGKTATLNFTSDEAGTYYYVVYAAVDAAPDAATIKSQAAGTAQGTAAIGANTVGIANLKASTAYKAYIVVEDAAANMSLVATISFTTKAAARSASSEPDSAGANVIINGKTENSGTLTTVKQGNTTVTTVTLDENKLEQRLSAEGSNAVITIPINTNSDLVVGELYGQLVKSMEDKQAVIEVKTETATYTLPAEQINIDGISKQLGMDLSLKDIKISIEIAKVSSENVKVVENSAKSGEFTIIAPPMDFQVKCTSGGKTVSITSYNAYVERTIAIPEGVDPDRITTGVVVDPDGTVHHVPTRITVIDGKYYAIINSLANSIYAVIWHPLEFKDAEKHWAKEAINDMGSRMIISGIGDDVFDPDRNITRAEFTAIVVSGLGLKSETGKNPFKDVNNTAWYCGYIETAYKYGIISGYSAEIFGPNDNITREQAMSVVFKAMRITGLKAELAAGEAESLLAGFEDSGQSAAWARESIAACVKAGIVTGNSGKTLSPKVEITRAQVAVIIRQLLQKSNLI